MKAENDRLAQEVAAAKAREVETAAAAAAAAAAAETAAAEEAAEAEAQSGSAAAAGGGGGGGAAADAGDVDELADLFRGLADLSVQATKEEQPFFGILRDYESKPKSPADDESPGRGPGSRRMSFPNLRRASKPEMSSAEDEAAELENTPLWKGGEKIRVLICSANLGNKMIDDLANWVPPGGGEADIIAFGLQESTYTVSSDVPIDAQADDTGDTSTLIIEHEDVFGERESFAVSSKNMLGGLDSDDEEENEPVLEGVPEEEEGEGAAAEEMSAPPMLSSRVGRSASMPTEPVMLKGKGRERSGTSIGANPTRSARGASRRRGSIADVAANLPTLESGRIHLIRSIQRHLGVSYYQVANVRRVQMRLLVYSRVELKDEISDVETAAENTGALGGYLPNKGGQAAKFTLRGTSLCFVNSHLAAHEGESKCMQRCQVLTDDRRPGGAAMRLAVVFCICRGASLCDRGMPVASPLSPTLTPPPLRTWRAL